MVWRMPSDTATFERFSSIVAERNAVDVQHQVWTLGVVAGDRDLLRYGEVVVFRVLPVDQPDGLGLLADSGLDVHAVAQQAVHVLVGLVEIAAAAERRVALQPIDRLTDQVVVVAARLQVLRSADRPRRWSFPRGTPSCRGSRNRAPC